MTSSPPEELSSFFISAAAWLSPGQQPATQGEGTSACLRIRDRLLHFPSVSPSDCAATRRCPPHPLPHPTLLSPTLVILERTRRSDMCHCLCQAGQTDRGDWGEKHCMHDPQQKALHKLLTAQNPWQHHGAKKRKKHNKKNKRICVVN